MYFSIALLNRINLGCISKWYSAPWIFAMHVSNSPGTEGEESAAMRGIPFLCLHNAHGELLIGIT